MSPVGIYLKPISLTQCFRGLLLCACILATVAGCEQAKRPSDAGGKAPVAKKVDENRVTAAEAKKFAKEYLSAINRPDTEKLLELVDWDAIVDRIFVDLPTENAIYQEYASGGKKYLAKVSQGIRQETENGGNYALLKTVLRGKDRHAIFRVVSGGSAPSGAGRINYHNLRLIRDGGKVRADDIYLARAASWYSEVYRTALQPVLLQSRKSAVGFTSSQREKMKTYKSIAALVNTAKLGNHAEASRLYQQLDEDTKKTKSVLAARMLANERDEFFKAADEMVSHYPNSPAVGLRFMDFGMVNEDLPTIKRASEMLEKWTAGDPYIDLNVAAITLRSGNVDEATEIIRKIDARKFNFRYPVFLKFTLAIAAKDNEMILDCCRILRDDYEEDMKKLLSAKACQDFVQIRRKTDHGN